MKIAVTTNAASLEASVHEAFESSAFLLIVEMDDNTFEAIVNTDGPDGNGMSMARELVRRDCEAVICGTLEAEAFEEISRAQITRYYGAGIPAAEALKLMDMYRLELIRVPNGETWVPHDHGSGECNCGEDHDEE